MAKYFSNLFGVGKGSEYVAVNTALFEGSSEGMRPLLRGLPHYNNGYNGEIMEIRFEFTRNYALPLDTMLTFDLHDAVGVSNNPDCERYEAA